MSDLKFVDETRAYTEVKRVVTSLHGRSRPVGDEEMSGNHTQTTAVHTTLMLLDAIVEEVGGTLCGLPPGTVTAAKAAGGLLAATGTSASESQAVERNTSGMNDEEKRVVATAVHNLAVTVKRDNPRWSDRRCAEFGMKLLIAASRLYDGAAFRDAMTDAVSASRARHHRLIRNVLHAR